MAFADAPISPRHAFRPVWWVLVLVIAAVLWLYWKARYGDFVWDEALYLVDAAWFRVGDSWKQHIFEPFLGSYNYFRPLVLALMVAQVRLFEGAPQPMHWMNIGLHAANASLVAMLITQSLRRLGATQRTTWLGALLAGLLYACHPAMVEPVAWISGQFDLVVTFLCLLALWADATIARAGLRIASVGLLFFLAALCKEAAAVLPPLLALAHWLRADADTTALPLGQRVLRQWREQRWLYLVLVAAGVAYLGVRYAAFGYLVTAPPITPPAPAIRWLLPPWLLARYVQIAVWPFMGFSPIHEDPFATVTSMAAADQAVALCGLLIGVLAVMLTVARRWLGPMLLCLCIALVPVLQIGGALTGHSLYQERFLTLPLAVSLALGSPAAWMALAAAPIRRRAAIVAALALWLLLAAVNVKITVPLWGDEITLWRWALRDAPQSEFARGNLIGLYVKTHQDARALPLADAVKAEANPLPLTLLNSAAAYINVKRFDDAEPMLERASRGIVPTDVDNLFLLIMLRGSVAFGREKYTDAAEAFHDAAEVKPDNSSAWRNVAVTQLHLGNVAAADKAAMEAERVAMPAAREPWRREYEAVKAAPAPPPQP